MNLFSLNGGTLNGFAGALVIAGAASIAASCSISVAATRQQDALAPTSSGANVTASATKIVRPVAAISCDSELVSTPTHIHLVGSNAAGSVGIVAFVRRVVSGESVFVGSAEMQVIPASVLGEASTSGTASLIAVATKVQPGNANATASGNAVNNTEARVTRFVEAPITGSVFVRVETQINGIQEGFSEPNATASFIASPVVLKISEAVIECTAESSANPTHVHPGLAQTIGLSLVVIADPGLLISPSVSFSGSANVLADLTRTVYASTGTLGEASFTVLARATQFFGSTEAYLFGFNNIIADCFVIAKGQAAFFGNSTATSEAVLFKMPDVNIVADGTLINADLSIFHAGLSSVNPLTSDVEAVSTRLLMGECSFSTPSAQITVNPFMNTFGFAEVFGEGSTYVEARLAEQGEVVILGSGSLIPDGRIMEQGVSEILGESSCTVEGTVIQLGESLIHGVASTSSVANLMYFGEVSIVGFVTLNVRSVANLSSADPSERTFNKPSYTNEFKKSPLITEFRRVA
jgi:hypothetical protein